MKKIFITMITILSLLYIAPAFASGYKWKGHQAPFDFLFGNHFDTHQQSKTNNNEELRGFFYIKFTGNMVDGLPEAKHGTESVGWNLKGTPVKAKLIDKSEHGHPVWCVAEEDFPSESGYSHFHWLNGPEHAGELIVGQEYDGYLLKLTARDHFFFEHHGGFEVSPGLDDYTHDNVTAVCN